MHRRFFVEDRAKPGIITRGIQTTHRAGVLRTVNQGRKMKGMLVPALLGVLMVCRVQVSTVSIQKKKNRDNTLDMQPSRIDRLGQFLLD